jgi:hypothetical protein
MFAEATVKEFDWRRRTERADVRARREAPVVACDDNGLTAAFEAYPSSNRTSSDSISKFNAFRLAGRFSWIWAKPS